MIISNMVRYSDNGSTPVAMTAEELILALTSIYAAMLMKSESYWNYIIGDEFIVLPLMQFQGSPCSGLHVMSTKNCWTGSNQFIGPQLTSSWENENSIRFPKISGTLYTGSRFAKESNSNSASSPSNVFTAMPVLFDCVAVECSGQSGSPSTQVCHPRWPCGASNTNS